MADSNALEIKILGHERAFAEAIGSTIDNFTKLEEIFTSMKGQLMAKIQVRRDRIEKIKRRIEFIVQKIQQVGKINKPLTFQSPDKYPEIKRPEKVTHNHASRHAAIFCSVQENKELLHLPDQLSKLIYTTDSDLKDLLEITRYCFDSKSFSTITSNSDLVHGVGNAPQSATSLSDFVMYGGSKNPYAEELKDPSGSKLAQEKQKEQEKIKLTRQENDAPMSVLHRGNMKDASRIALRPSKPPPRLLPTAKVQFKDAFDLGGDQEGADDDLGLMLPAGRTGLTMYADAYNEDAESPFRAEDQRVHGDALDFISEKKPAFLKHSQSIVPPPKPAPSQPAAMPRMSTTSTMQRAVSSTVSDANKFPTSVPKTPSVSAPSPSVDAPVPPAVDVPQPPPMDIPEPPSIDVPAPPPIDVPAPPPIDVPAPPPIDVPAPPPISVPSLPSAEQVAKQNDLPPPTSDRSKFLESIRQKNPLAALKPVPKDSIKDASLTYSEKRAKDKQRAKAGMAKAQNSLMDAVRERFKEMNKNKRAAKADDSGSESD